MPERMRVLVAGWLNSPHVRAWADLVASAGHDVHVVGRLAPGWPELDLPFPSHRLSAAWPPPLRGFAMSRALGRVARELEPDLVHAHYLPEYGWMAAREKLRPLVSSAWGSDVLAVRGVNRPRAKRALRTSALVFADSAHLAREVRALGGPDVPCRGRPLGSRPRRVLAGRPGSREAGARDTRRRAARRERSRPEARLQPGVAARGVRARAPATPGHAPAPQAPLTETPESVAEAIDRLGLRDAVTILGNVAPELLPERLPRG